MGLKAILPKLMRADIFVFALALTNSVNYAEAARFGKADLRRPAYGNFLYSGAARTFKTLPNETDPKKMYRSCTAFLVGNKWAVTAQHCLDYGLPDFLYFEWDSKPLFEYKVKPINSYSMGKIDYSKATVESDWTLLELSEEVPSKFKRYRISSLATPLKVGSAALMLGYPINLDNGDTRILSECTVRALKVDQIYTDCDLSKGSSGGPLLVQDQNGEWVVAGVNSTVVLEGGKQKEIAEKYTDDDANHHINLAIYSYVIAKICHCF